MMTQPAGATVAAHKSGTGPVATTPNAAPFSQTLQALNAGLDCDVPLLPGTGVIADQAAADASDTESAPKDAVAPNDAVLLPQEWLLASTGTERGASAPQVPAADPPPIRGRTASTRQPAAVAEAGNSAKTKSAALVLPKDLMRALFTKESALSAQAGKQQSRAAGVDDDRRTGSADDDAAAGDGNVIHVSTSVSVPVEVPVPVAMQAQATGSGAALLAAVLQWLQPSRSDAGESGSSASAENNGQVSDASPLTANTIATTTIPGGQSASVQAAGAHPDTAVAVAGMTTTPTGAALTTAAEAPHLPRDFADVDSAIGGMNMAAALRATSAANPAPAEHSVAVPVHDRHWPTAMAAQVLILSSDKVRAATLRLSPEHLGPVEVHIDMQDSNVNVNFTAAHAETRAALEQAMPQLRTVLAGAGLTLGQATVQQQARRESQNSNALPRAGGAADETIEAPIIVTRSLGMIDEYV